MNYIMFGKPGAGKGTQAKKLAMRFGSKHISTGDILRQAIAEDSDLGRSVAERVNNGEFVDDETMTKLVIDTLRKTEGPWVLDGFPRSLSQQLAFVPFLIAHTGLYRAIIIDTPNHYITGRICDRRSCPKCGMIYNRSTHPEPLPCLCGTPLVQREDDKIEFIQQRLLAYAENTAPVLPFYRGNRSAVQVSGTGSVSEVHADILRALADLDRWGK
jgi:adenylate kinase